MKFMGPKRLNLALMKILRFIKHGKIMGKKIRKFWQFFRNGNLTSLFTSLFTSLLTSIFTFHFIFHFTFHFIFHFTFHFIFHFTGHFSCYFNCHFHFDLILLFCVLFFSHTVFPRIVVKLYICGINSTKLHYSISEKM